MTSTITGDGEEDQREREARHGGPHHVPDVGEEIGARHRRREVGGIGERRDLVAEVGAGDDRPSREPEVQVLRGGDAHERHAHGSSGGPRATGGHGHERADHARRGVEHGGIQDLEPVVDHGRHHAAQDPGADHRAHHQQNQDRAHCQRDAVDDPSLDLLPCIPVPQPDDAGDGSAQHQRYLVGSTRGRIAEEVHRCREQRDEKSYWDERLSERRVVPGAVSHLMAVRGLASDCGLAAAAEYARREGREG